MTNHKIDNSLRDLGKTVLWQYDKAYRLLSLLKHLQTSYYCAVEKFWEFWNAKVLDIEKCGAFGAKLWGILLGIKRPLVVGRSGYSHELATSVYRLMLNGAYYLMGAGCDFGSLVSYLEIVFGIPGDGALSEWMPEVAYGWGVDVEDPSTKTIYSREADGSVHKRSDSTLSGTMVFIKLRDGNGIVRKVGGTALGSLYVSVSYAYGDEVIVASASRRRKSGVSLVDNGNMSLTYGKSEHWDSLTEDQQLLFEQHGDEVLPYPLGIGDGTPAEEWVFGFEGQQNVQYEPYTAYAEGDVFGYVDAEGHGFNWKCTANISSGENRSFDAIRDKVVKTYEGDPFVSSFSNEEKPYDDYLNYGDLLKKYLDNRGIFSVSYEGLLWIKNDGNLRRVANLETPTNNPLFSGNASIIFLADGDAFDYGTARTRSNAILMYGDRFIIIDFTNFDELLAACQEAMDLAVAKRYFSKTQGEVFMPNITYWNYVVLELDGERRMLAHLSQLAIAYPSVEAAKRYAIIPPKVSLICEDTERRLYQ